MATIQQTPTVRKAAPLPQNAVRCPLPPRKAPAKDIAELLTPAAVAQSHHGSILLPYLARVGSDFLEHRPQTPLQRKLAMTLSAKGLAKRCVARYGALPKPLTTLFDERLADVATPAAEVDQIVLTRLNEGAKRLRQEADRATNGFLSVRGTISDLQLRAHSAKALQSTLAHAFGGEEPQPTPTPARYDFWLDYRGISIYVADEESGRDGVDPYFQAEFFTIPPGSSASASVIPPLVVAQSPQDLEARGDWYPNGGASDSGLPNWIYPVYYTADGPVMPGIMWPPLSENDAHFCTIQVWECDDYSVPEDMAAVSGALMALGTAAAFGSPHLGILLVTVGALSELLAWLLGDGAHDYVGGFCLLFDKEDLEYPYDQSIGARVQATENSNDWELFFGLRSKRIAD